jgi:hypothetical protein
MQPSTSEYQRGIIGRFELETSDHDADVDARLDRYKPLFLARGLTASERATFTERLTTACKAATLAEQLDILVGVLGEMLIGWRHVYRGTKGDPVPFDPAALPDLLTLSDLWAIAFGVMEATSEAEFQATMSDPVQLRLVR